MARRAKGSVWEVLWLRELSEMHGQEAARKEARETEISV
jgi:hypothetical protein